MASSLCNAVPYGFAWRYKLHQNNNNLMMYLKQILVW